MRTAVVALGAALALLAVAKASQKSVEIRVVVDREAVQDWNDAMSTGDSEAQTQIREYVKSMFEGTNAIYKGLQSHGIYLDFRIIEIIFAPRADISNFVRGFDGMVNADSVLNDFKSWINNQGYSTVDHNMLVTGHDLVGIKNGQINDGVAGVASVGAMCGVQSHSAVELTRGGMDVLTMAHELGHSLSAQHDGEGNHCNPSGNVMAAQGGGDATAEVYRFSSCSRSYFNTFLASHDANCLSQTTIPRETYKKMGELYDPDTVCKMVVGSHSYFYRSGYGPGAEKTYDDVCSTITCVNSQTEVGGGQWSFSMKPVSSTDGFPCGQGKRCNVGSCVSDSKGPRDWDSNCAFGDTPAWGHLMGTKCADAGTFHCSQDSFQKACCKKCNGGGSSSGSGSGSGSGSSYPIQPTWPNQPSQPTNDPWGNTGNNDPWGNSNTNDPWGSSNNNDPWGSGSLPPLPNNNNNDPWGSNNPWGGNDPWGNGGGSVTVTAVRCINGVCEPMKK